jgi:hypothetical protein
LHMSALEKEILVEQSAMVCHLLWFYASLHPPPPSQGVSGTKYSCGICQQDCESSNLSEWQSLFPLSFEHKCNFAVTEFKLGILCFFICQTASMRVSLCICFTFAVFICLFSDYSLFILFWFNDSLT